MWCLVKPGSLCLHEVVCRWMLSRYRLLCGFWLLQARDNVKFLTTLERHFRSVSSGPLAGILDTLPPLMNALRMVWIISRHYSDDARMGALFARIATELCDRVDGAVMLHQLFRMPAAEAIELLRVSKAVLESWQSTYMQVGISTAGCPT